MKELSNFSSRKEWEEYLWKEFAAILNKNKSGEQTHYLLNSLLTAKERTNIIRRLVIISLIKNGKSYKEISEILWLSPNTISSISKSLKNNLQYKSYFEISKNKHSGRQAIRASKQFSDISWSGLADSSIEFLEAFNRILNKLLPPITGKGRWGHLSPPIIKNKKFE